MSCRCPHTHTHTHTHRAITAEPCRVHAPCSRVFVAILAGAASGIMGIEGIAGFVTFFASSMVLSLGMYLKMNSNPKPYFKTGSDVWTEGIGQALMVCHHRMHGTSCCEHSTRTNPNSRTVLSPDRADACAVIRDVLDAILRHRAHLLSNPAGGSRGTTRHGARAGPGGRARWPCRRGAVHGQSVSSWCRQNVSSIVTKEMKIFLISWRCSSAEPLRGATRARGGRGGCCVRLSTLCGPRAVSGVR